MDRDKAPIEGGYGWVVLLGCICMAIFVADGYASFGVFMVECNERFDIPQYQLVWVGAVRLCLSGLAGILIGSIIHRFGVRIVCLTGTTLLVTGHLGTALFPSLGVPWILVMYGAISGIGHGCYMVVYCSAFQEYFYKRRGLANAIVTTGTATGVFIWPAFLAYLFASYGWTGGLLIMTAIYLNGCVLTLIIVPARVRYPKRFVDDVAAIDTSNLMKKSCSLDGTCSIEKINSPLARNKQLFVHLKKDHRCNGLSISYTSLDIRRSGHIGSNSSLAAGGSLMSLVLEKDKSYLAETKSVIGSHSDVRHIPNGKTTDWVNVDKHSVNDIVIVDYEIPKCKRTQDIYQHDVKEDLIAAKTCSKLSYICEKISQFIDFSVFKNVPFLLYCIGLFLVHFGHVAPFILLPSRAAEIGISKGPASLLVSILGISNLFTRLLWGWVADCSCMSHYKTALSGLSGLFDGLTSMLSFLADDYAAFVVFSLMWGSCSGGYTSLQNTIVVHLLDVEKISKGAGTLVSVLGVSWLITYVLAGILIDLFGSTVIPFCFLGCVEMTGGLLIISIPFVQRFCYRENKLNS